MPSSTARGIPYPLSGESPDGPSAFSALAAKVDSLFDAVWALLNAATSAASASTIMRRDAGGNASVATPTATDHAATKAYVDTAIAGTNTTLNNRIRAGVATVTTNANGDWSITFSSGFPSTLASFTVTDATATTTGAVILKTTAGSSSNTGLTGRAYSTTGAVLANYGLAISYIAIGY